MALKALVPLGPSNRNFSRAGTQRLCPDQRSRLRPVACLQSLTPLLQLMLAATGPLSNRERPMKHLRNLHGRRLFRRTPLWFPRHSVSRRCKLADFQWRDACSGYPESDVTRLHFMLGRDNGVFAYEVEPEAKVLRGSRGFRPRVKPKQCRNWEEHKGISLP